MKLPERREIHPGLLHQFVEPLSVEQAERIAQLSKYRRAPHEGAELNMLGELPLLGYFPRRIQDVLLAEKSQSTPPIPTNRRVPTPRERALAAYSAHHDNKGSIWYMRERHGSSRVFLPSSYPDILDTHVEALWEVLSANVRGRIFNLRAGLARRGKPLSYLSAQVAFIIGGEVGFEDMFDAQEEVKRRHPQAIAEIDWKELKQDCPDTHVPFAYMPHWFGHQKLAHPKDPYPVESVPYSPLRQTHKQNGQTIELVNILYQIHAEARA
jgi:hypothetical protein